MNQDIDMMPRMDLPCKGSQAATRTPIGLILEVSPLPPPHPARARQRDHRHQRAQTDDPRHGQRPRARPIQRHLSERINGPAAAHLRNGNAADADFREFPAMQPMENRPCSECVTNYGKRPYILPRVGPTLHSSHEVPALTTLTRVRDPITWSPCFSVAILRISIRTEA